MMPSQRRTRIFEELRNRGSVRVVELADLFSVSEMTVRRDLDLMQESGLLVKVHGGAVVSDKSAEEPGFEVKVLQMASEKAAIAREAIKYVSPGNSVAVSAGSTTWALAKLLPTVPNVTVVTNSLSLGVELHDKFPSLPLIMTGGVPTPSGALVGLVADVAIESLYVDVLFLGVHGMDPEAGLTTPNLAEAQTNRTLLRYARRVVVLADHTKWRKIGMARIAPISVADVLITDEGISDEARISLADSVGDLTVASLEGERIEMSI